MKAKIILVVWVAVASTALGFAAIGGPTSLGKLNINHRVGGPMGMGTPVPPCTPGVKCQVDPLLEGGPMPPLCRPGTCPNTDQ